MTVAILVAIALTAATAQQPASGALLVLSKGAQTLSVVDPSTLKVVGSAPSGPDPHEVIASADGRFAYIANYNGGGNIITVIDLTQMKALAPIDLGPLRAPHGLDFAGGKLWFTAEGARAVGSYDPSTQKVDWTFATEQSGTHMLVVSRDLSRIVTSNIAAATATFIERAASAGRGGRRGTPADWTMTTVPVGRGAEGFDVSPDGREVWMANAQDGTISVIDVATKKVTATLQANVSGANRLKFTPDGKLALVSTLRGEDLTIIDATTRREVKRLKTGRAAGIQMQPDGSRAYVACTPANYVAVIDLKSLEMTGRIDAGPQPDGMAWVAKR